MENNSKYFFIRFGTELFCIEPFDVIFFLDRLVLFVIAMEGNIIVWEVLNMSTIIVYATKYGFTKTCAELLAKRLGDKVDICDLSNNQPDLMKYDKVIVGGSIYAGKIRKPVMRFCLDNLKVLKEKKLGLFICGMAEGDAAQKQLESTFPKELLSVAACKESFGGECNYDKMNFLERFIMKKITGSNHNQIRIAEDSIARLASQMR